MFGLELELVPTYYACGTEVEASQEEQVSQLPEISIDDSQLVDDDSDVEQTAFERQEQSIEALKKRCGSHNVCDVSAYRLSLDII